MRLGCPISADFTLAWSEEVLIIGCLSPWCKNGIIIHARHACEGGKRIFYSLHEGAAILLFLN